MPTVILVNKAGLEFPVTNVQGFIEAVYSRGALPKIGSVRDNYEALQQNGPPPVENGNSFVTLNDLKSATSPAGLAQRAALVPWLVARKDKQDAPVMVSPPTVTYNAAATIVGGVQHALSAPANPSAQAGGAIVYGAEAFGRYSAQSSNATTFAADAAVGATTVSLAGSVQVSVGGTQLYSAQPLDTIATVVDPNTAEIVAATAITGTGPYAVTLAAPLTKAHKAGDRFIHARVPTGPTSFGSAVWKVAGTSRVSYEFVTNSPTVEIGALWVGARSHRIWVDGEWATAAEQTAPVGGAAPASNAYGFVTIAFGSAKHRRIRFETTSMAVAAITTEAGYVATAPARPKPRALFVGDSYLGGIDDISEQAGRALGWTNVMLDQIGGTGYEADNTANLGYPGRAAYRLPRILGAQPAAVVVCLGYNDTNTTTLAGEALSFLSQLVRGLPTTSELFVVGPWASTSATNTTKVPVAQTISDVCKLLGLPFIDTGLLSGTPWINDSNSATYLNEGQIHPSAAGIAYIAGKIAEAVAATGRLRLVT